MTEDESQYWQDQYVTAIVNDSRWHHALMVETKGLTLHNFFVLVDEYCRKLKLEFPDIKAAESMEAKVYIRLAVLEYLCEPEQVLKLCKSSDRLNKHIDWCNGRHMAWLADKIRGYDRPKPIKATPEAINGQPETTQENTMPSIEIKNVTFINNTDVNHMTDEQLIGTIKNLEQEISDLEAVKSKSVAIGKKVGQLNETLLKVVAILDAR